MGKIRLVAVIYIFVIICSITGCGTRSEKSLIIDNNITINETNRILNTVLDDLEDVNYENYLKKIWVVEEWNGGAYEYPSFFISEIQNSNIYGRYSTLSVAKPEFYFYSNDPIKYLGQLTGTFIDESAYLNFSDAVGNKGNLVVSFKEDVMIEAIIEYTKKGDNYKDIELDGHFVFVPYNLVHIKNFIQNEEFTLPVKFDYWGDIIIVTGEINTGDKVHPVSYLTNKDNDILYVFEAPFKIGTSISDVKVMDINDDGLQDVIITTTFIQDSEIEPIVWIFAQNEDGTFYNVPHME